METGISDSREKIFDLQCPRIIVRGSQTYKENRIVEIRMTEETRHTTYAYSPDRRRNICCEITCTKAHLKNRYLNQSVCARQLSAP